MLSRHKGALSNAALDRQWPHQVALTQDYVGEHFRAIHQFADALTLAPRHRAVHGEAGGSRRGGGRRRALHWPPPRIANIAGCNILGVPNFQ